MWKLNIHKHEWEEPIYQQYTETGWGSHTGYKSLVTIVTQRCKCGKHRQQKLEGHIEKVKSDNEHT